MAIRPYPMMILCSGTGTVPVKKIPPQRGWGTKRMDSRLRGKDNDKIKMTRMDYDVYDDENERK